MIEYVRWRGEINGVTIGRDDSGMITVSFPYNPLLVAKVKTVPGHKWHPAEKYWSFPIPNTDGTLKKILNAFEGEKIHLTPELQAKLPSPVIARHPEPVEGPKQSQTHYASRITHHDFQDLRRELLSRKYSYQTVKAYLYYNRDFIGFTDKRPLDISENDIKDYLLHLAEEKVLIRDQTAPQGQDTAGGIEQRRSYPDHQTD